MSQNNKNQVLEFLQNLPVESGEVFNKAFELYKKSENKNKSLELNYNRLGCNERNLKNLLYDLQKVYGISDVEVLSKKAIEEIEVVDETPVIQLNTILPEETNLDLLKAVTEAFGQDIIIDAVEELQPIREEFAFLNDKDCPHVFYTIVGLRISKYKEYKELFAKLQNVNSDEFGYSDEQKLQITADCEAAYNENQKLWDELNYYNLHKEILGKHLIFRESNIEKEVGLMTNEEMFKFKNSSVKYFFDQKKAILKNVGKTEKLDDINQKVIDREYKLSLINAKLGINIDDKK